MTAKIQVDNSLPHLIANDITERIMNQQLQPGEQLREGEVSDRFGTSRAPVREAFYLLEVAGLIERLPRRGCRVKAYSWSEMIDIVELRNVMELLALKRYTPKTAAPHLKNMQEILRSMEERFTEDDKEAYSHLNQQFHRCIIRFSGSKLIETHYSRLSAPLRVLINKSWEGETLDQSIKDHQQIVKTLLEEDIEKAAEILSVHNLATITRLKKHYQSS
ncbi:GntR family transcriptional regulator [Desmospora activa]|uniref:GntR family transcriptional regulator n=1 Tax=Desmospora activa DSM 45169 TaxID=1121389 RepID=A0A2T4Z4N8_9BACL|nr:GntR family transcriptional regulator [Desmospora activa]PTM56859.1 GntR family transcriptional regulator [Desmospora activa DSM 45169]